MKGVLTYIRRDALWGAAEHQSPGTDCHLHEARLEHDVVHAHHKIQNTPCSSTTCVLVDPGVITLRSYSHVSPVLASCSHPSLLKESLCYCMLQMNNFRICHSPVWEFNIMKAFQLLNARGHIFSTSTFFKGKQAKYLIFLPPAALSRGPSPAWGGLGARGFAASRRCFPRGSANPIN